MKKDTSYLETFYEVTSFIEAHLGNWEGNDEVESTILERYKTGGHGSKYEIAEEWTNEFEELNKDREWDGEFFVDIEDFCRKKNEIN